MGVEGRGGQGLFQTSCRAELDWIDLFTDTASILNLLDLRIIMGCPGWEGGGGSVSIYARFSGKKKTSMYISLHPNATQQSFLPITIFF